MIIEPGMKVHVVSRPNFEGAVRRHFVGKVIAAEGACCSAEGFVFIMDEKTGDYVKRQQKRTSVFDLAESGYNVNIIDINVDLESLQYRYIFEKGMVITDDKDFSMNISEFGLKA